MLILNAGSEGNEEESEEEAESTGSEEDSSEGSEDIEVRDHKRGMLLRIHSTFDQGRLDAAVVIP